jgi:hypothetical protein
LQRILRTVEKVWVVEGKRYASGQPCPSEIADMLEKRDRRKRGIPETGTKSSEEDEDSNPQDNGNSGTSQNNDEDEDEDEDDPSEVLNQRILQLVNDNTKDKLLEMASEMGIDAKGTKGEIATAIAKAELDDE